MDVEIVFYCSVSLNILRYFNERRESDRTARETVESKKTAKTLFIFARKKEKQTEELEFLSVSRKITFRRLVSCLTCGEAFATEIFPSLKCKVTPRKIKENKMIRVLCRFLVLAR